MTKTLLCIPATWEGIAPTLVSQILARFDGVRTDVHPGDEEMYHNWRWQQILSYKNTSAFVIFLIGPHQIDLRAGQLIEKSRDFAKKLLNAGYKERGDVGIEIGNEPDLAVKRWKKNPEDMAKCFADCYVEVKALLPDVPVLCPSISNLNGRGLNYLEKMEPHLPKDCGIAFHRYPNGRDFDIPHRGFTSRFREVDALKAIAGCRALWNTETGHAEINKDYTLSESEVSERMEREHVFWSDAGCEAWCAYQINSGIIEDGDGHDDKRLKSYGARRADSSWKPWADRMGELKA